MSGRRLLGHFLRQPRCSAQRGHVRVLDLVSRALAGNPWGDPVHRDVHVYTPPGYDRDKGRRYPVVLLLPAYASTGEAMLARGLSEVSMASRIDALIEAGCPPFLAVMPEVMTRLGGSQFVDSTGIGAYASFLVQELRPFLDRRFRTTGVWGLAGRSSGGFGALHLAMEAPGAFSAVVSHAGDMGFDLAYWAELPAALGALREAGGDPGSIAVCGTRSGSTTGIESAGCVLRSAFILASAAVALSISCP